MFIRNKILICIAASLSTFSMNALSAATGTDAVAIGKDTSASGNYTVVIGNGATSAENTEDSIAIGNAAQVLGYSSVAIGSKTYVPGILSTAIGQGATTGDPGGDTAVGARATATGNNSTAMGHASKALTAGSVAIGSLAVVDGSYPGGMAIGSNSHSSGWGGLAFGSYSNSLGDTSAAFGYGATATEDYSLALGRDSAASGINSVALGSYSKTLDANGDALNDVVSVGNSGASRKVIYVERGILSADSSDAVNGSQLYETNQDVSKVNTKVEAIQSQVTNIAGEGKNNVIYDGDSHQSITLSSTDGGTTSLSGLKDGNIASGSTSAVTGNQLWETKQQVSNNTTNISNLENKVNNSGIGIVQKNNETKSITIGKNDNGKKIDISGTEGNRTISGVADGSDTYDAVNVGQLQNSSAQSRTYSDNVGAKSLSQANRYTDSKIRDLDKKINKKNQKQDAGIASAVAIGSIPQNWQYQDHLGMGVGGYNGQGSVAAKYGHKIKDNVALSISAGLDTSGTTAYGAGIDIGW